MLYRITIISDEEEDFLREITIDANATFLELHNAILDACGYKDDQITSFFLCDEDWEQKTQITREDMGFGPSDEDIYVMADTPLSDMLEEERQHLVYVFDPMADRVFYIELREIITGKHLDKPVCSKKRGNPPVQIEDFDFGPAKTPKIAANEELDGESFYGSDDFDTEEFDPEGFEISDGDPYNH